MEKRAYVVKYYEMIIHIFDTQKEARKVAKEKKTKLTILTYDKKGDIIEVAEEDYSGKKEKELK